MPDIAKGQPATEPSRKEALIINSGTHDGNGDIRTEPRLAFKGVARISNAPWLRLYFGNSELGRASFLKIISLEDGAYQFLNSISLKQWQNTSAFFNGDAVEIELYVAPEDKRIFFENKEVAVGKRPTNLGKNGESFQITSNPCTGWLGICGGFDDRVSSNDPAIGRIIRITAQGDTGIVGTGWIASNGTYIAAGHLFPVGDTDAKIFEFGVPASDPDGTPNFAHPNNQYSIDLGSVVSENVPCGRDWALYRCFPNSNTGLLPVQAQNAFYRLSLDSNPPTFRVTGFGLDECLPGSTGGRNSNSVTQQTSTGTNYGESGSGNFVSWSFAVDIRNGNSGSPIIPDGTSLSVGIQTCGSTSCPPNGNSGTSMDCDPLENAVNIFPGANIIYADNGHPFATGIGTVFRPYSTVTGAVNAVPTGGIVSIVRGTYTESMTINRAMTLTAPVGTVTIGPSASPIVADDGRQSDKDNLAIKSAPTEYSLSQNYPNPFNPETTIEYTLPKTAFVMLKIYDMLGQEVRTLVNEFQQTGVKSVNWDGKNDQGQPVPSGIYIYQIVAGEFAKSARLLLLK
jgi:hypothetical protein